ncbi:MAG: hypothetical protein NUV80_04560, partial [Candidatus Berkelbacteria bacterium]|nr:hypothetical protein [Candidatus Berkelbacteria bacterium]
TNTRLETYIGIAMLLIAVLGFLFSILASLPKEEQISQAAHPLPQIPRDMFSSSNELNKMIQGLHSPSGVPVTINPTDLGRSNIFENP